MALNATTYCYYWLTCWCVIFGKCVRRLSNRTIVLQIIAQALIARYSAIALGPASAVPPGISRSARGVRVIHEFRFAPFRRRRRRRYCVSHKRSPNIPTRRDPKCRGSTREFTENSDEKKKKPLNVIVGGFLFPFSSGPHQINKSVLKSRRTVRLGEIRAVQTSRIRHFGYLTICCLNVFNSRRILTKMRTIIRTAILTDHEDALLLGVGNIYLQQLKMLTLDLFS